MNVKKKRDFKYIIIIGVLAATGWFLFQQKPDVRSTTVTHTDGEYRLWVEVNANRWTIENREQFAEKLLKMVDENTFQKVHFSEDLEEPHCIIFRVYLMPYHSNWAFEVCCGKQKKTRIVGRYVSARIIYNVSESKMIVNGPSLTSATFISAPNSPVFTQETDWRHFVMIYS